MYIGELIDHTNKCIIKAFTKENAEHDYLEEIESTKLLS